MSCDLSIQKQLLTLMDSLVSSIVTEICQLDIFQSKRANTETDIKLVSPFKYIVADVLKFVITISLNITVVNIVTAKPNVTIVTSYLNRCVKL